MNPLILLAWAFGIIIGLGALSAWAFDEFEAAIKKMLGA